MIKSKIMSLYPALTKSEKKIADFILKQYNEGARSSRPRLTSYELAETAMVSQPTIIRFSQKLGFDSFNILAKALEEEKGEDIEIEENDSSEAVLDKIEAQYISIIDTTKNINSKTDLALATDFIKNAGNRVVFGVGTSGLMCNLLARKLNKVGLYTMPITGTHLQRSVIKNLGEDDVVIFFSQSGETRETIEAAEIARDRGVKTICITAAAKNRLSSICHITIKTAGINDNIEASPTTLKVSQMFAIDMLFLSIIKEDKEKYNELLLKNGQAPQGS